MIQVNKAGDIHNVNNMAGSLGPVLRESEQVVHEAQITLVGLKAGATQQN